MPNIRRQGFKRVSGGASIKRVRVYQCRGCGMQFNPGHKPDQCLECGRMDFFSHDSTAEASRYATLGLLEKVGKISDLNRQVRFPLMAAKTVDGKVYPVKVGEYVADFVYVRDGKRVIEDLKGDLVSDLASWKLRHMAAMGLEVRLTKGNQ